MTNDSFALVGTVTVVLGERLPRWSRPVPSPPYLGTVNRGSVDGAISPIAALRRFGTSRAASGAV